MTKITFLLFVEYFKFFVFVEVICLVHNLGIWEILLDTGVPYSTGDGVSFNSTSFILCLKSSSNCAPAVRINKIENQL